MKINLNARVRVTLTAAGVARVTARDSQMLPKTIIADRGVWECQLWELMSGIGPNLYNGAPQLIVDNELEVLTDDPLEALMVKQ